MSAQILRVVYILMFTAKLKRIRQLSESTRDFRFVRTDGEPVQYAPGQFFRFVFEDAAGEFERSYSLCNFKDTAPDVMDLVISKVQGGRATKLLFESGLEELEAKVTGPFGRLILPKESPGRLILAATSVGLAPYMPILRQLLQLHYASVVLLLGVRDRSEFIYGDELLDYAAKNDFFELRLCLSREQAEAKHEYDGYVTAQVEDLQPAIKTDHYLLCGNPQMIDDVWGHLKEIGFRPRQVVREKYVFAREKKAASADLTAEQKRLIAEKMKKYS